MHQSTLNQKSIFLVVTSSVKLRENSTIFHKGLDHKRAYSITKLYVPWKMRIGRLWINHLWVFQKTMSATPLDTTTTLGHDTSSNFPTNSSSQKRRNLLYPHRGMLLQALLGLSGHIWPSTTLYRSIYLLNSEVMLTL